MTDDTQFNRTEAKRILVEAAANSPSHDKDMGKIEIALHERSKSSQEYWNYINSYIVTYLDPNYQMKVQDSQNTPKPDPNQMSPVEEVLLEPKQAEKQNMAGPILNQTVTAPLNQPEQHIHQNMISRILQNTKKIESQQQIEQSLHPNFKLTPDQSFNKTDGTLSQSQSESHIQQKTMSGSLQITKKIAKKIERQQVEQSMQSLIALQFRPDQIFTKTGAQRQSQPEQVQQQNLSAPVQSQNTITDLIQLQKNQEQRMHGIVNVNNLLLNENGNHGTLQCTNNQADTYREVINTIVKTKKDQNTSDPNKRVSKKAKNTKKIGDYSKNRVKKKIKSSGNEEKVELKCLLGKKIRLDNVLNLDKNSNETTSLNINKSTELNDTIVSCPCIPAAIILSPECDLTVEEAETIKTQLTACIQKTVTTGKDSAFSPSFEKKPSLSDGILKIWCANKETFIWLSDTTANIPTPRPKFKLEVIKQADLPKKTIIQLFIPEYKNGQVKCLIQLLKQQNSWYNIDAWTLYRSQHTVTSEEIKKQFKLDDDIKEGMLLWFGISKKEECKVRDRRGLVSYLLESIHISLENVCLENPLMIASRSESS